MHIPDKTSIIVIKVAKQPPAIIKFFFFLFKYACKSKETKKTASDISKNIFIF